jgi:hypothetical protein
MIQDAVAFTSLLGAQFLGISVPEDHALFEHPGIEPYRLMCLRVGSDTPEFLAVARCRVPGDLGE